MILRFSKEMYPKIALIKAAYNFTDRAYLHLDTDDCYYIVEYTDKTPDNPISKDDFTNEMLVQCVRYEVLRRTHSIRELLVARAMASTMIENQDCNAEFIDYDFDVSKILSDWFEKNHAATI